MSVVAAAKAKYVTLSGVGSAPLYFDDAPVTDTGGAQVRPPYVVLKAEQSRFEAIGANTLLETTPLTFEVYADTLAAADAIAAAINYSGGGEMGGQGFVYGSMTPGTGTLNKIMPAGESRRMAGVGQAGQRVHCVSLRFDVEVKLS